MSVTLFGFISLTTGIIIAVVLGVLLVVLLIVRQMQKKE